MAQVIAPLLAPLFGTAASFVANMGLYVATTAASYFIQQAMQPKPETGTKLRAASGGAVSQSMIVGEKETAGSLIYVGSWGKPGRTPNAYMVRVYCLSDTPCEELTNRLWASGKKCTIDLGTTAGDGSGNAMGHPVTDFRDDGNDYMWVKFLKGDQSAADPYLRAHFGNLSSRPWTANMIGHGRALMIVTERYNKDEPTSLHECVVVPKGKKLYDWRKDPTNGGAAGGAHRWGDDSTYEYSANPVVIAYNIMRGIYRGSTWLYGGQNWPARRFDNDSWTAAANVCDENVSLAGGGTEKRYRMGAEISFSEEPLTVLDRILAACNGRLVESGGIYKVYAGGIGAAVYSFTDDDVVVTEALTGNMFPGREDICNTVTGSYCEPDNGGQMKAYKKRSKSAYVTEDNGEVRSREMSFDYVRNNRQAQRLALHGLNDNRRFMTKVVAFPSVARKLEPGDAVNWSSSARFGFTNKKFIVGDVTLAESGVVSCVLREADAADANWSVSDEETFTVGVYGDIVPAPQQFAATVSAIIIRNNAGTAKRPGIRISADVDADDVDCKALKWQVKLKSGSEKIVSRGRSDDFFDEADGEVEFSEHSFLPGEQYQVRYKVIPYSDRKTVWSNWVNVTMDDVRFQRSDIEPAAIGSDELDMLSVDTQNMRYRSISGAKVLNAGYALRAFKMSGSSSNWTGDNAGQKFTETIVIGDKITIDNSNPSPVRLSVIFRLRNMVEDSGSLGDGLSFVNSVLSLQAKKSSQLASAYKNIKGARKLTVKCKAKGMDDVEPERGILDFEFDHYIPSGDAGDWDYRVLLTIEHQRGADRDWSVCEIWAGARVSLSWMRR
jgi:hypothetical protein